MSRPGSLLLVRHAESIWNAKGLVQGQSPLAPGLTEKGIEQGRTLARNPAFAEATLVMSSDLRRAIETARFIVEELDLPLVLEPRLRERAFGVLEGNPSTLAHPSHTGIGCDTVLDADARPDGGETLREFYSRVAGLLDDVMEGASKGPVILVTHGGVLRAATAYLGRVPPEKMSWAPVANSAVFEVSEDGSVVEGLHLSTRTENS